MVEGSNEGSSGSDSSVSGSARGKSVQDVDIGTSHGRSGTVSARGTADGLILRVESNNLSSRLGCEATKKDLWDFLSSRRSFIAGNDLILEWASDVPEQSFIVELKSELSREFDVSFRDATEIVRDVAQSNRSYSNSSQKAPSLFDGMEALGLESSSKSTSITQTTKAQPGYGSNTVGAWDEADARVVYGTLRSGQRVESEHSLVIIGDVNSGAEVIAGGDVVVLGCLRGIAHAGAYEESGGGRTIFALTLEPTQLRIGSVISRGPSTKGSSGAEVAKVEGDSVIVEAYQSRSNARR